VKFVFVLFCLIALTLPRSGLAIDLFLTPDSIQGLAGQVVTLSGEISATDLMRSFTVYFEYDTNRVDLFAPPMAGPVIAGHVGLQFNYFDHAPILPTLLEVTATVFGTDFWQGPGVLFQAQFLLRDCGDVPITAPYEPFLISAVSTYPPATFTPTAVLICDRVPQPPSQLVIYPAAPTAIRLNWDAVRFDTLNRPLLAIPVYQIERQAIQPVLGPLTVIAVTPDTFYTDSQDGTIQYNYDIRAEVTP
jgi:hypothetical protein